MVNAIVTVRVKIERVCEKGELSPNRTLETLVRDMIDDEGLAALIVDSQDVEVVSVEGETEKGGE